MPPCLANVISVNLEGDGLDGFFITKAKLHRHLDCKLHDQRSAESMTSGLENDTYSAVESETVLSTLAVFRPGKQD